MSNPTEDKSLPPDLTTLITPTFTFVNRGFDDKAGVVLTVTYTDNTSAALRVSSVIARGSDLTIDLKSGTAVRSYAVFVPYGGQLRQCGKADGPYSKGFRRCSLWWAVANQFEEVLAYGS